MEREEILALLTLAERIQNRLMVESDEHILQCLESDYNKVRIEIGRRVLNLPLHVPIFDNEYSTILNNVRPVNSTTDSTDQENNLSRTNLSNESSVNIFKNESQSELSDLSTDPPSSDPNFLFESEANKKSSAGGTSESSSSRSEEIDELAIKFRNFLNSKRKLQKSRLPVRIAK